MLRIHFINVAEGDAILLQYKEQNDTKNILVDTGHIKLPYSPGSCRQTAGQYLKRIGVSHLDILILTHLHIDHVGGLQAVREQAQIDRLYSSYIPLATGWRKGEQISEDPLINDLTDELKRFAENIRYLKEYGCSLYQILEDRIIYNQGNLCVKILCADWNMVEVQNLIYHDMMECIPVSDSLKHWAAAIRNDNSMRVAVTYAGRRIQLEADYYYKEKEWRTLQPCDILKVNHHGDAKSLTEEMARRIHPRYAIISCQREYVAKNDRPSKCTTESLRRAGATVYYTDSYLEEGVTTHFWPAVVLDIMDDGTIISPTGE